MCVSRNQTDKDECEQFLIEMRTQKEIDNKNNQLNKDENAENVPKFIKKFDDPYSRPEIIFSSDEEEFLNSLSNCDNGVYPEKILVQKYIGKPLLRKGHKFQMKFAFSIVSTSPLVIYFTQKPIAVQIAQRVYRPSEKQVTSNFLCVLVRGSCMVFHSKPSND